MMKGEGTYLDGLPVIPKHVHPYNGLIEIRICALRNIIIEMLLIAQCVHSLKDKVKQCF